MPRTAKSQMLSTHPCAGTTTANTSRQNDATLTRLPRSLSSATGNPTPICAADAANTTAPSAASLMWNDRWMSGASTPSPLSTIPTMSAASVRYVTGAYP